MWPERYSCDRCRQQKVRCLKNHELSTTINGVQAHLTPCDRCIKADVPCVYSSRQRKRRPKGKDASSPIINTNLALDQHLPTVLSSSDIPAYNLNDLMIPPLETTMGCMNDDAANSWNSQHDLTYNTESDERMQEDLASCPLLFQGEGKETLAEQLMKLTNRAMGATRELECAVNTTSLTINSPPVNEMFEAANALVHIINSLTLADSTDGSLRSSSRDGSDGNDRQLPTEYYPIFLALDSYQRVLSLFHAVCEFIKRSLGSITQGTELQQQTLHGAGSSSAQFIMVLQLMIHLLNRIGRSLRMGNRENIDHHELIFVPDGGGERGCSDSIVDCAQGMLKMLPDEHVKLLKAIRELQACIEESVLI